MTRRTSPCPHCGAPVARGALVCRECGSDAATGWAEEPEIGALDRPAGYGREEEFDYDDWLRREVDGVAGRPRWRSRRTWRRLGLALLVGALALALALA